MATGDGTPRTYDVSDPLDVPAGDVNIDQLITEIADDAGLAGATFDFINRNGDILDVFFTAALTAGEITALDALLTNHVPEVLTQGFQVLEDNVAQSTTSDAWIDALTLNAAPLQAGRYIMSWNIECRIVPTGPVNSRAEARFRLGGNPRGRDSMESEGWQILGGWDFFDFGASRTPTLNIQVQREGGNDTIEFRRMKLAIQAVRQI